MDGEIDGWRLREKQSFSLKSLSRSVALRELESRTLCLSHTTLRAGRAKAACATLLPSAKVSYFHDFD